MFALSELLLREIGTNVVMKDIEVGDAVLELPSDTFDTGDRSGTIIDSGTTLAYLPDVVYNALMTKV